MVLTATLVRALPGLEGGTARQVSKVYGGGTRYKGYMEFWIEAVFSLRLNKSNNNNFIFVSV